MTKEETFEDMLKKALKDGKEKIRDLDKSNDNKVKNHRFKLAPKDKRNKNNDKKKHDEE